MARKNGDDTQDMDLSRAMAPAGYIHDSTKPKKPNWSLWGEIPEANVSDTAILSCDVSPEWFRYGMKDGPNLQEYFRRWTIMRSHIEAGTMPGAVARPNGRGGSEIRIILRTFAGWAKKKGWPLPSKFPPPEPDPVAIPQAPEIIAGRWPWGTHETPLLGHLAAAAECFWAKGYDPGKAPTNPQVAKWLRDRGVPKRDATFMAHLLRPLDIPHGPRRKANRG